MSNTNLPVQIQPVRHPLSVYMNIEDVPYWMKKNRDIVLHQLIYTRDMKVLIVYTLINFSDD